jgi:hypothetical protein
MDKIIRISAYLFNAGLFLVGLLYLIDGYGTESLLGIFMMIASAINLRAIYFSPDIEERRLIRSVNKARLKKELEELLS